MTYTLRTARTQLLIVSAALAIAFILFVLVAPRNADALVARAVPVPSSWCTGAVPRFLDVGVRGNDVTELQLFLIHRGVLAQGYATGYFGAKTFLAVATLQSDQGIASLRTPGSGRIGPRTWAFLRSLCNGSTNQHDQTNNSSGFQASPSSGTAPLSVGFSAQVQIAGPGIVGANMYKIVFGDGQEQVLVAGPENQSGGVSAYGNWYSPQSISHTYTTAGTYAAQLVQYNPSLPPMYQTSTVVASQTITVTQPVSVCKPLNYMPINCGDGTAAIATHDANNCITGYVCPVANFTPPANCKAWNDGCNVCSRSTPSSPAACTMRACFSAGKGYCSAYFETTTSGVQPTVAGFSGPTTLTKNQSGTWSISASDGANGYLSYNIVWGDEAVAGTPYASLMSTASTQNTTFTHAYSQTGTYTIAITVTNQNGQSAKTTSTVVVTDLSGTLCTQEFAPVCGRPVGCVNTCVAQQGYACPMYCQLPAAQTYSNRCMLNAAQATFLYSGACQAGQNF